MTRILLVDDHGIVRQGLRAVLARDASLEVVGESADGREAVRLADALQPDVVIMDISMPQLNGIEAAKQILRANSRVKVIVLSMHSDETYLIRALNAGVTGFLLKESAEVDLVRAVLAVAQGKPFFSPAVTSALLEDYMRYMQQRNLQDSYELLTDREKEVLQLLAEGKTNKEVSAVLEVSPNTIDTHRTNLMQKLGLHNTAEVVLYAVRKKIIQ
ncbi:MAG: response regulator transcription factor [Terriglobia bacterium]